jgi:SpoVK/Ycf46/Vps4 family AAA+-type ATPase
MPRSDLILNLVRSARTGDRRSLERSVEAMIVEEKARQHGVFAKRLEDELRTPAAPLTAALPMQTNGSSVHYWFERNPERELGSLELPERVSTALAEILEEQRRADLLRSHGLEPRHRILVTGPPGNGKTSLAEAIATDLMLPVITPRYESLIGSYLGETATRLGKLFEHARTRRCVLFFDEFDTLGRERAAENETGEIKRVVSSLLLQIDALPSYVVVVVATNHPETLDRAVWRRFQLRAELPAPTLAQAARWFSRWAASQNLNLPLAPRTLADGLRAQNYAELEEFCLDVMRRKVLAGPDLDLKKILSERLTQWKGRTSGTENG